MVDVYFRAWATEPTTAIWLPSAVTKEAKESWLRERYIAQLAKREVHMHKVTEVATGKLAAFDRWTYPFTLTAEEKEQREQDKAKARNKAFFPKGANEEAMLEFFGALDAMQVKYVREDNMYG
jgi:hypothetical protein